MKWPYIIAMVVLASVAGLLHGFREAQHADADIFEERFEVEAVSFFGSESWLMKYEGQDAKNKIIPFHTWKSDFWHLGRIISKVLLMWAVWAALCIEGSFCRRQWKLKTENYYWLLLMAAVFVLESSAAWASYTWLRYGSLF